MQQNQPIKNDQEFEKLLAEYKALLKRRDDLVNQRDKLKKESFDILRDELHKLEQKLFGGQ